MRDNIHRREDLVERYRLTRERLAALKRQRRDIIGEERTILQVRGLYRERIFWEELE